ncbi:hypothetical protein Hanom_Chr05g00433391 [Helianthus anomalus]
MLFQYQPIEKLFKHMIFCSLSSPNQAYLKQNKKKNLMLIRCKQNQLVSFEFLRERAEN